MRNLISTQNKKAYVENELSNILPKSSHSRKKPPPPTLRRVTKPRTRLSFPLQTPFPTVTCGRSARRTLMNLLFSLSPSKGNLWQYALLFSLLILGIRNMKRYKTVFVRLRRFSRRSSSQSFCRLPTQTYKPT